MNRRRRERTHHERAEPVEFGVLIERAAYLCTVETHRLLTAAEQEEARRIREIYSESLAELGGAEREALEAAVRQYKLPETDTSPCEPRPDELDILLGNRECLFPCGSQV